MKKSFSFLLVSLMKTQDISSGYSTEMQPGVLLSDEDLAAIKETHNLKESVKIFAQNVSSTNSAIVGDIIYSFDDLETYSVFSPNFEATIDGKETYLSLNQIEVWRGKVNGASVLLIKDESGETEFVNIRNHRQNWNVDLVTFQPEKSGLLATIMQDHYDVASWKAKLLNLGSEVLSDEIKRNDNFNHEEHYPGNDFGQSNRGMKDAECSFFRIIEIAVAFDASLCQSFTRWKSAAKRVKDIVALASTFYEVPGLCVRLRISKLEGWCDFRKDPYRYMVNRGDLLDKFSDYWIENRGYIKRDTAHLFSGTQYSKYSIGVARLASVCSKDRGYGVQWVLSFNNLGGQAVLFAHELGHNCGAVHVAENTEYIMSTGHRESFDKGFTDVSIQAIRRYLDGENCLEIIYESSSPSISPTVFPSPIPTFHPSPTPTFHPSPTPSQAPTAHLTISQMPSLSPTFTPSFNPTFSQQPTISFQPSPYPSISFLPTYAPSNLPSHAPSNLPSFLPSFSPSSQPSTSPSFLPTNLPSATPTLKLSLTRAPSPSPSFEKLILFKSDLSTDNEHWCMHLWNELVDNGSKILLWTCMWKSSHQTWILDTNGYIRSHINRNKCIIPQNGEFRDGIDLIIWDCPTEYDIAFTWYLGSGDGTIQYGRDRTKVIDVTGAVALKGQTLQLWTSINHHYWPAHVWSVISSPLLASISSIPSQSPTHEKFILFKSDLSTVNEHWCMHLSKGLTDNGNGIVLKNCWLESSHQTWLVDDNGYIRSHINRNKCIIPQNGEFRDGIDLVIWDCPTDYDIAFTWYLGSGDGTIQYGRDRTKVIDVSDAIALNGQTLQLWSNMNHQQYWPAHVWHVLLAPTLHPTLTPTTSPSWNKQTQQPINAPITTPSHEPSQRPSIYPFLTQVPIFSQLPSGYPKITPSYYPSISPSSEGSRNSTSHLPSHFPMTTISFHPSFLPTKSPLSSTSDIPSIPPTIISSPSPSLSPNPRSTPSDIPSPTHSVKQTNQPTFMTTPFPTFNPNMIGRPSSKPSHTSSNKPSSRVTDIPSINPTIISSPSPSLSPNPRSTPSDIPSPRESVKPINLPTHKPTTFPTFNPSMIGHPSSKPSHTSNKPNSRVTDIPSINPTIISSPSPSLSPNPRSTPSDIPSPRESVKPINLPTQIPTSFPTFNPSMIGHPSSKPSHTSSKKTSVNPTSIPTQSFPQALPSELPTVSPDLSMSDVPLHSPTAVPLPLPSMSPNTSTTPSSFPSTGHSATPVPSSTLMSFLPTTPPTVVPRKLLTFKSRLSSDKGQLCLHLRHEKTWNGNKIQLRRCQQNSKAQIWNYDQNKYLRSEIDENKCIIPRYLSYKTGTYLVIWDCPLTYKSAFTWTVNFLGSQIKYRRSKKIVIGVKTGAEPLGQAVRVQRNIWNKSQKWVFIRRT